MTSALHEVGALHNCISQQILAADKHTHMYWKKTKTQTKCQYQLFIYITQSHKSISVVLSSSKKSVFISCLKQLVLAARSQETVQSSSEFQITGSVTEKS